MASVLSKAQKILAREGTTLTRLLGKGSFELAYVRPHRDAPGPPIVVIPGGPGMASVVPYAGFRKHAKGLDIIMVEHRGVGLSRTPGMTVEDVTVEAAADDIAAVLDAEGIERAVIHGASYGTYLAQAFAARYTERVMTLVLDSPMLTVEEDIEMNAAHRRSVLLGGKLGPLVSELIGREHPRDLTQVTQVVYEFAGAETLARLLRARVAGKSGRLWKLIAGLGANEVEGEGVRGYMEPELVSGIAYGQLGFGLPGDGEPLDSQAFLASYADSKPQYRGEPFDFPALHGELGCPVVVASGERDLRTPEPVARRIVDLARHGTLVQVPDTGHSLLDTHQLALVRLLQAVRDGEPLEGLGPELGKLAKKGNSAILGTLLKGVVRLTTRPDVSE